jgi:hypothetical protein
VNNAKAPQVTSVDLTLLEGLYTEAAPESLPPGASPLVINCDFEVGEVTPRPGKKSQYTFAISFIDRLAGFGGSAPNGPNQQPWKTPNNITKNAPPLYAEVSLNSPANLSDGVGAFDKAVTNFGTGTAVTTPTLTPAYANEWALLIASAAGQTLTPSGGFAPSFIGAGGGSGGWFGKIITVPTAASGTLGVSGNWAAALVGFQANGGSPPMVVQNTTISSGGFNGGTTVPMGVATMPGNTLVAIFVSSGANNGGAGLNPVFSDSQGNVYTLVAHVLGTNCEIDVFVAPNIIGGANSVTLAPLSNTASGPAIAAVLEIESMFTKILSNTAAGNGTTASITGSPDAGNRIGVLFETAAVGSLGPSTPAGWTTLFGSGFNSILAFKYISATGPQSPSSTLSSAVDWSMLLDFVGTTQVPATTPTIQQSKAIVGPAGSVSGGNNYPGTFTLNVLANNSIFVFVQLSQVTTPLGSVTVTDNQGNIYLPLGSAVNGNAQSLAFVAFGCAAGSLTVTVAVGSGSSTRAEIDIFEINGIQALPGGGVATGPISEVLSALNFGFSIPATTGVLGFQTEITGHQNNAQADAILHVSLINPSPTSPLFLQQLPSSDAQVVLGTPAFNWGLALTPALLNDPNFGLNIQAFTTGGEAVTFDISAVKIKAWLTPGPLDFNYIKTYQQTGGEITTLALGSDGVMYGEDVVNNPNVLTARYTAIEPESFAQSCTQSDREFIAISDLLKGTDIPYTFDGKQFDRLSQVGPGAPPTCTSTSAGSPIVSITQNPPHALLTGSHDWLLVSDSPADHKSFGTPSTPGNVFTIIFRSATPVPPEITPGSNIFISGFPAINGNVVNNDPTGTTTPKFYTVTSIGQAIPGQQSYDAITFVVPFTTFYNKPTPPGCQIQSTTATMTTSVQVPNLEVGNQFQVSGTGGAPPGGYDSTWLVLATPNAAQMQITSTSLTGNVATYAFNLITGTAPVVGQAVTVTQTLNGNGIFNITQGIISSVTAGTFSVGINSPDIASAAETGAGIIFGTIFQFDAFAIIGNRLGGTVVSTGTIASGVRKCCYSFLTRNGYLTKPSPIVIFDVPSGASAIAVAHLATGPDNVIARVVHFTAANGGNFLNIKEPVTVQTLAGSVVNTSTWVLDNTTTNVVFSFSDAVLLGEAAGSGAIDVQGNNLFETAELGSSVALIPYGARVFALGEQNKLTNLLNWSFDGGIGIVQSSAGAGGGPGLNATYPLGWTVDPTNGTGGSVVSSPIFGFAYQISNTTGVTKAIWGMITQGAFQDEFMVPIIQASTAYSVRVTASVPTGPTTGNLIVDLFDPAAGKVLGSFSLDLSTVATTMNIFTGTLLTTVLAPVPQGLLLRVYGTNILNGVTIQLDRVEVFPTEEPNLSTQLTGSYVDNFEAFDQITGVVNAAIQNQQAVKSAFILYDTLYLVKTGSLVSTQDNGTTEPVGWSTRVVSSAVGTTSVYGVTTGIDEANTGEEWAIIAGQPGAFIFNGGQPIKLTEEIQSLWNQINWKYGHTLWVKNDIVNRRILFGVPLKVPNQWFPTGLIPDDSNPTTPNVIIELNYKQLNTAGMLESKPEVHVSYSGKLIASEIVRKWSIWTIVSPCAAFVTRPDTTAPLFLGNSQDTGKIYSLEEGQLDDDGSPIPQIWDSYGFVTQEQEKAFNLGSVRKLFEYMTLKIDGTGDLTIKVFPNTLDSPFAHALLPDLILPASNNGDTEVPVNEIGSRLFLQFMTFAVGAGFKMSKIVLMLREDPWSPVRGRNN